MFDKLKPPILLFGNTRSGTTVVQKVMSTHPDVAGWYEPNTLWAYADPGRQHDEFDENDAAAGVKKYIRKKFYKYQRRWGDRIVFEKTPRNILRIPYVRAIFHEAVFLFIVRNPFSFISSVEYKWQRTVSRRGAIRRLKETPVSQLHYWVRLYLVQQFNKRVLRLKYLPVWGPRYKGIQSDLKTHDLLTVIARQWSVCSSKAEKDMALFEPGRILRLKYEEFVENPIPHLERICAHCNLGMNEALARSAREIVRPDPNMKWKRLGLRRLARVLPEIQGEMQRHGYEIPAEIAHFIEKPMQGKGAGVMQGAKQTAYA